MKMCEWYILITHDNCTCIFHDLSKLFSSAHEVSRFRRALPCFYPGKVTVTIIRSMRGGMFKMLLWDFWQRMGHELINIHLGTDDSPFVVRPCLHVRYGALSYLHICDLTIVWKNACQSNTTQPNRDCFWYHFTPRKLLYHMISVNLSNLGHLGCPFFFGGATLYNIKTIYAERISIMESLPLGSVLRVKPRQTEFWT